MWGDNWLPPFYVLAIIAQVLCYVHSQFWYRWVREGKNPAGVIIQVSEDRYALVSPSAWVGFRLAVVTLALALVQAVISLWELFHG